MSALLVGRQGRRGKGRPQVGGAASSCWWGKSRGLPNRLPSLHAEVPVPTELSAELEAKRQELVEHVAEVDEQVGSVGGW